METAKSELKKIVTGFAELLKKSGPLEAPSWRFPEQLSTSVNIEEVLKSEKGSSHEFILELIIDRFLLLLQCSIQVLEGSIQLQSHSSPLPLTLGSAVKKLSKCILKSTAYLSSLDHQIVAKNEVNRSLESALFELREEYKLLQEKNDMQVTTAVPSSDMQANSEKFTKSACMGEKIGAQLELKCSSLIDSPFSSLHDVVSIGTQTTDTAFALCTRCHETQHALVRAAHLVAGLCKNHELESELSLCEWERLAEVGRLETDKWTKALQIDLKSLEANRCLILEKIKDRDTKCELLKEKVDALQSEIEIFQARINTMKDMHNSKDDVIATNKKEFTVTLASLEAAQSQLQSRNNEMEAELNHCREQVSAYHVMVMNYETSHKNLETHIHALEAHELELKEAKRDLEAQLESVVIELQKSQEMLSDQEIELNKSKLHSSTLKNKYETLKSKQSGLLSQLDEIDEESSRLREELIEMEITHSSTVMELKEMQAHYKHIQEQFHIEQNKLEKSQQEEEKLNSQLTAIKTELARTEEQLDTEKNKCRMLMDYPFKKPTDVNYRDHVTSLVAKKQIRQQVTANTIRICLLEEQNDELRHRTMEEAREHKRRNEGSEAPKPGIPTRLWENKVLQQLIDEQTAARNSAEKLVLFQKPTDIKPEAQSSNEILPSTSLGAKGELSSSNSKLKGRLGHLVMAIADSHAHDSSRSAEHKHRNIDLELSEDVDIHLCDNCDKMFYCEQELKEHIHSSCENITY